MTPTVKKILDTLGPQYSKDENGLLVIALTVWCSKLDAMRTDIDAALAQLSILTASSFWLDQWGQLYAIPREANEQDDAYASRLIAQTIRQRPQPMALEQIIENEFPIHAFYVRDLWPFVLLSDQWTTPPGKPLQVSDGQLDPHFLDFGPQLITVSFSATYLPGSFGIWVSELTSQLLTYTLQQVINLLPLVLLSDQFSSTVQVSDGQLTTPDFGGPLDTARHSFSLPAATFPVSIDDILSVIDQHRAAGTRAVVMGTQLQPVSA